MAALTRADSMENHDNVADDLDRISALPDDLLHVILTNLSDAAMVTRTAVLSRRWQRVWIHAQKLYFADSHRKTLLKPGQFSGFVDWAFAQRGNADMQSLIIHVSCNDSATPEQVNHWLRYAMQHAVKTFIFYQPPCPSHVNHHSLPIVELPSHGRTASIELDLSASRLRLPASPSTMCGELTELNLTSVCFDEEEAGAGGRILGDFVSSCCPRLRKLDIWGPRKLSQLVLCTESLEELRLPFTNDLWVLDVTAPKLRIFCLGIFMFRRRRNENSDARPVIRIVAPKLEEIDMDNFWKIPPDLHIRDLASVCHLSSLGIRMHGRHCSNSESCLWFLKNCPNVEHLDLCLRSSLLIPMNELVDLMDKSAPRLHKVKSMVLKISCMQENHFVESVQPLLMMCPGLRSLCVKIFGVEKTLLSEDQDTLVNHPKLTLEFLKEVTLIGFTRTDEELDLVSLLFGSSGSIISMSTHATPKEEADYLYDDSTPSQLMKIPFTDHGCWHFQGDVYTWRRYMTEDAGVMMSGAR